MIRRRRRSNWVLRGLLVLLAASMLAYVVVAASIQAITSPYHFRDLLIPRAADCLVVIWLFWIGSAIGSFLNVVAWRMPLGRSINGLSHCPRCGHRLAARDNCPVFGWIALRGRCRTCRLPISARYPIVECLVGLTLTFVGLAEIYGGLTNLPYRGEPPWHGPMSMPTITRQVVGVWLYHTVAIAGSWALALVRFDDQRLPAKLTAWVLGLTLVPMLLWPHLTIVPWQATVPANWPSEAFSDSAMRVLCGLVAAAVVGRSLARYLCPTADPKLNPTGPGTRRLMDLIACLIVPAVVVGWQALLGVVLVASLLGGGALRWIGQGRDGLAWFVAALPVALSIQIVWWRSWEGLGYWPGSRSPPWVILAAAAAILVVPALLRSPAQRPREDA